MTRKSALSILLTFLTVIIIPSIVAQAPSLPPHPRLILTPDRVTELQALVKTDPSATILYNQLVTHVEWVMTQNTTVRPVPGPSGILIQVRQAMDYMLTSAIAYLISGNSSYYQRGLEEALEFASWSDYNPWAHTLDTGEAGIALGLFLDWMYNDLSETDKTTLVNAMIDKVVTPFNLGYKNHSFFWVNNTINWNCVCSGGAMVGAMSIADEPTAPTFVWPGVFSPSLASIPVCVAAYSSEGSWEEGEGYWEYATKYVLFVLSSLHSSQLIDEEAKLSSIPGVNITGTFPAFMTGAAGELYDWADSERQFVVAYGDAFISTAPSIQYFGSRFNDAAAKYYGARLSLVNGFSALNMPQWATNAEALIYYTGAGSLSDLQALPTSKLYSQRMLGMFRTGWTDPTVPDYTQSTLHFKGGNNGWNHNHLDLSSFVFDWRGWRVASDLGADNYNLPDYFGPTRWTYYRLNSFGHNIIKFNHMNQNVDAVAPIVAFNTSTESQPWAVVDTDATYKASLGVVNSTRGFVFMNTTSVSSIIVADHFIAQNSSIVNVTWSLHVNGTVIIDPNGAQNATIIVSQSTLETTSTTTTMMMGTAEMKLRKYSEELDNNRILRTLSSPPATIAILPASMGSNCPGAIITAVQVSVPQPQYSTAGITRIDIISTTPSTCTDLVVAVGDDIRSMMTMESKKIRPSNEWVRISEEDTDGGFHVGPFYNHA